jgi:hypothetical protein
MKYELIDGDTKIINIMVADGWKIENTFPNPYPQPYFFALMRHDNMSINDVYDTQNIFEHIHQNVKLNPFKK